MIGKFFHKNGGVTYEVVDDRCPPRWYLPPERTIDSVVVKDDPMITTSMIAENRAFNRVGIVGKEDADLLYVPLLNGVIELEKENKNAIVVYKEI